MLKLEKLFILKDSNFFERLNLKVILVQLLLGMIAVYIVILTKFSDLIYPLSSLSLFLGILLLFTGNTYLNNKKSVGFASLSMLEQKSFRSENELWRTLIPLTFPLILIFGFFPLSSVTFFLFLIVIMFQSIILLKKYLNLKKQNKKVAIDYLKEYKPEVALYAAGMKNFSYQVNMWLKVLEHLPFKCIICTRSEEILEGLHKTNIPIVFAKNQEDLELLIECDLKLVLYSANAAVNTHMLRHAQIMHAFINHGESDKVVNQSKFLCAYDKILVAGEIAKQRLIEAKIPVRDDQVALVGRPSLELELNQIEPKIKRLKTVLYAPTWEGFFKESNYSSIISHASKIVEEFRKRDDFKLIFRPHPYTGSQKKAYKKELCRLEALIKTSNNIKFSSVNESIFDVMNESDIMITDLSSVISDYLYTGKPVILCSKEAQAEDETKRKYYSTNGLYFMPPNKRVISYLEEIIENDYLLEKRKVVTSNILNDPFKNSSFNLFSSEVKKLVDSVVL